MIRQHGIKPNERRKRIRGNQCVYCGQTATTDEHFPPYSYSDFGYILPACSECNNLAHTAYPKNFMDRVDHVRLKLRAWHHKLLELPEWTEDELADMEWELATDIRRALKRKEFLESRLSWEPALYLKMIDHKGIFRPIIVTETDLPFDNDDAQGGEPSEPTGDVRPA